ncbi:unnamed protein product [Camellia sinensis]
MSLSSIRVYFTSLSFVFSLSLSLYTYTPVRRGREEGQRESALKMKLKQQLQEEEETQVLEAEEQENPRSPLKKIKKKLVPKKPKSVKSKPKQVISDDLGKSGSCKKKRTRIEDLYDNDEAKCSVMERADEVLENVADEYPSFIKCMLPSNVTHGFWLILPKKFCNLHLPMHDTTVILVDECGKEYEANFLVERHGLSGGWRGFSLAHRLLKGDILVFHLIKPCTLKVHIVRVYGLDEVDAALCLLNLVTHAKRTYSNKNCQTRKKAKKCVEPLLLDIHRKDIKTTGLATNQYETNSDDFGSEVLEGSEISDHRANESSYSQNPILHDHLLKGTKCRFTTGKVT